MLIKALDDIGGRDYYSSNPQQELLYCKELNLENKLLGELGKKRYLTLKTTKF